MKRTLWTLFILAAVAIMVTSFWDKVPGAFQRPGPAQSDQPLVAGELIGVETRSFDENGMLAYDFLADKLTYYQVDPERESDADYTAVTDPFFAFHQAQQPAWFLEADEGTAFNLDERLVLQNNVRAWQNTDGDATEILTSALTIHLQPQIAETDKPVIIQFPGARYTAEGGLSADMKAETFVLHDNIKGVHEARPVE